MTWTCGNARSGICRITVSAPAALSSDFSGLPSEDTTAQSYGGLGQAPDGLERREEGGDRSPINHRAARDRMARSPVADQVRDLSHRA
jgi:hypothetical protein